MGSRWRNQSDSQRLGYTVKLLEGRTADPFTDALRLDASLLFSRGLQDPEFASFVKDTPTFRTRMLPPVDAGSGRRLFVSGPRRYFVVLNDSVLGEVPDPKSLTDMQLQAYHDSISRNPAWKGPAVSKKDRFIIGDTVESQLVQREIPWSRDDNIYSRAAEARGIDLRTDPLCGAPYWDDHHTMQLNGAMVSERYAEMIKDRCFRIDVLEDEDGAFRLTFAYSIPLIEFPGGALPVASELPSVSDMRSVDDVAQHARLLRDAPEGTEVVNMRVGLDPLSRPDKHGDVYALALQYVHPLSHDSQIAYVAASHDIEGIETLDPQRKGVNTVLSAELATDLYHACIDKIGFHGPVQPERDDTLTIPGWNEQTIELSVRMRDEDVRRAALHEDSRIVFGPYGLELSLVYQNE